MTTLHGSQNVKIGNKQKRSSRNFVDREKIVEENVLPLLPEFWIL